MIRPGGDLRFCEHVRALAPRGARIQEFFDLVRPHIGGGCYASRDTLTGIEQAGFAIERCARFAFKSFPFPFPTAPHVLGIARRAA